MNKKIIVKLEMGCVYEMERRRGFIPDSYKKYLFESDMEDGAKSLLYRIKKIERRNKSADLFKVDVEVTEEGLAIHSSPFCTREREGLEMKALNKDELKRGIKAVFMKYEN